MEQARREIQQRVGLLTRQEALERLERADVPCGPVRSVAEVVADRHFIDRGTLQPLRHGALDEPVPGFASGFPVVFSGGPLPQLAGAPTLGMHNLEIYGKLLDLGEQDLAVLEQQGVI